jgi:hypothetical protein
MFYKNSRLFVFIKASDCADYGANVCTEYAGWAKENCQKHCNLCSGRSNVVNIK